MREEGGGMGRGEGRAIFMETNSMRRSNLFYTQLHSDPNIPSSAPIGAGPDDDYTRNSSASTASHGYYSDRTTTSGGEGSPYNSAPWNQTTPYVRSPWSRAKPQNSLFADDGSAAFSPATRLVGSLIREEGHIYSLASSGELLYTGSDSKNIRVWKNQEEYAGFKSNSGLVKAIVIAGDRIFTGHQDGKIRIWRVSRKDPTAHKRIGTLPTFKDLLKSSVKPSNYVEVRRHRNSLWIRHSDAVSCLSLSEDGDILYSGSWDKSFKVWRVADSRCLESVRAHDDAVNAILAGFDGFVFTGSADGTVKAWRREFLAKGTKHSASQTLLNQDSAVTALALNSAVGVVYSGSSDGLVNFWERKKSFLSHGGVLRGHTQAVLCMASAGSLVMSGSADGTICIWRRDDGVHTSLSILTGHTGPVKCIAVERDGDCRPSSGWVVYSGSLDKSVNVWKVSEPPAGDNFCRRRQDDASCYPCSAAANQGHNGATADAVVAGEGASHRFASPVRK